MLIYRIESASDPRRGAFQGIGAPADFAAAQARQEGGVNPYTHPSPRQENIDIRYYDVCGMPSLDAYRTWFASPTIRAALWLAEGYHMRVYDVPDHLVKKGMMQCCFNPDNATSVRVATPEEIA